MLEITIFLVCKVVNIGFFNVIPTIKHDIWILLHCHRGVIFSWGTSKSEILEGKHLSFSKFPACTRWVPVIICLSACYKDDIITLWVLMRFGILRQENAHNYLDILIMNDQQTLILPIFVFAKMLTNSEKAPRWACSTVMRHSVMFSGSNSTKWVSCHHRAISEAKARKGFHLGFCEDHWCGWTPKLNAIFREFVVKIQKKH